jgi:CheY-like chemotaxis protein
MNAEAKLTGGIGTSGLCDQGSACASYTSARAARVLLIDDDPSMKHMLANYLEQHDKHVTLAS